MRVADWYDAQTMRLSENSHFQAVDWSLVHCQTTTEWDSRPTITHPTLISIHTHPIPLILSTTGLFLSRRVISPIVGSHHKHDYHQRSDGTPTVAASIVSCRCCCVELSFFLNTTQHDTIKGTCYLWWPWGTGFEQRTPTVFSTGLTFAPSPSPRDNKGLQGSVGEDNSRVSSRRNQAR